MRTTAYTFAAGLLFGVATAMASGSDKAASMPADQAPICGEHMMSAQERDTYHRQMHDAATPADRERLFDEHRHRMMDRAHERGMQAPDCRSPYAPR